MNDNPTVTPTLTLTEEEAKAVARQQNRKFAKKLFVRTGAAAAATVVVLVVVKKLTGSVELPPLPDLPTPPTV